MSSSDHWLWRLSADEWLRAAAREVELGRENIDARRRAVTHARRGAGMALNGMLVAMGERGWPRERCETQLGRSYLEHLRRLAESEDPAPLGPAVAELAAELLAVSVVPGTGLVQLGRARDEVERALDLAARLLAACAAVCA